MKTFLTRTLVASFGAAAVVLAGSVAPGGGLVADAAAALPNTAIHGGPKGTTRSRTARFHLAGSRAVRIQCKINRGRWYTCAKRSSAYLVLRNLRKRKYTLRARAVNRAGKVDRTPAVRRWRVR